MYDRKKFRSAQNVTDVSFFVVHVHVRTMARVQERKYGHVRTYGQGLERLLAHKYGQGSCTWLGRNGETTSSSCSWGGNGMRRVHREATERVGANRLGRNGMRGRVHREGLDGTADGNEAWRTAEWRKRPCVRPATFEMGSCSSGGVWHTAKWSKRTSYGRNEGHVDREGCGVPQNGGNGPPTVETGVLLIGRGVAYRKTDETDLLQSKRGSC